MNRELGPDDPLKQRISSLLFGVLLPLIALGMMWGAGGETAVAAPGLSVTINTAYNLVVDSNVSSPSTYAPRAATVYATFCNESAAPMTNVFGYIGNYNGGVNSTAGTYPVKNNWTIDNGGSYFFKHVGPTADATRYIGDLAPGQCKVQYWSFTYPVCTNNNSAGDAFTTPCQAPGIPTWGLSVKADDDLSLRFDVWAKADGGYADNKSWTMTMRNEISAMANKIRPNPDGSWFNTNTATIVPGAVITTNGVLYTLGNVRQGFDNDGNFTPDYNAWLQPFGDPSYDPSCFRLIRTSTVLTVSRSAGQPNLILHTNDLNPHPVYGGPLYFTNLPPDNNGVRGEVRYTFLALTGPCSVPISPYQEVASGSDNEKFNGDFGTGIPVVKSTAPEVTINKSGPDTVSEPGTATYSIAFANTSTQYSAGITLSSGGVNMPLVIRDEIPDGLTYVAGSAGINISGGITATIWFYDGTDWTTAEPAPAAVRVIEWWLNEPLPAGGSGVATFQAAVPTGYVDASDTPIIVNEACINFGRATDFACDEATTYVLGTNVISGYVFEDTGTGGSFGDGSYQDQIEDSISAVTVTLYISTPQGYVEWATTTTDSNGFYQFTQLPDGDYKIVVDANLPDVAYHGWTNTTDIELFVMGLNAATSPSEDNNFGFAPALTLEKTLIGPNPALEDQLVSYSINLINQMPGTGTAAPGTCSYEYVTWSNDAVAGTTGWVYFPDSGIDPFNGVNELDNRYAVGTVASQADGVDAMLIDPVIGVGTATNTDVILSLYTTGTWGPSSQPRAKVQVYTGAASTCNVSNNNGCAFTQDLDLNQLANAINNEQFFYVNLNSLNLTPAQLANYTIRVVVYRTGGNPVAAMYLNAVGWRLSYEQTCGGTVGAINPLPLTDTFDADKLEFVSAVPAPTSFSVNESDPYANTGALFWGNLGTLYPGGTETVMVTFRVKGVTFGQTITNTVSVTNAFFVNGLPASEATDDAITTVIQTSRIGDRIWADIDEDGTQDPGEVGIPGVTVRLTPSTNVTIDGVVYGPNAGANFPYLTTVTNSQGEYLFIGLPHGVNYTVNVISPAPGFIQTGDPDRPNADCRVDPNVCNNSYTVINLQADFLNADFGYIAPNVIAGTVWFDANANAQIDGESPLAGWEVRLTGPSCNAQPGGYCVTTTNADGLYVFYVATDGNYTVTVIPPAGYTQTAESANTTPANVQTCAALGGCDNQVTSISVAGGNVYAGYDFGYRGEYAIEGFVYADWNSDASFNNTDVGWEGIPVILYDENGEIIATTTTDSDGKYTFEHLPPGDYVVKVDQTALPSGYSQTKNDGEDDGNGFCTTCASEASVTITSGSVSDVNFGYEPAGTGIIGDFVWYDNNGNSIPNASEPGLDGITVELHVDYGDGNDYVLVATTTTVNGAYSFSNLPPGNYRVQLDPNTIGDLQYTTASSFNVALAAGQTYLDADFGLANGGIIGDTIYWDANSNADQDWNEPGIPGVTVSLQISNTVTNSWEPYGDPQVTDANGNYLFTGLPAGEYRVVVDTSSAPIVGRELTGDPDTNGIPCYPTPDAFWVPFCDSAHIVNMRLGQTYLGADFGYQPTGVIGDFIWLDSSNFGVQDPGEPGLVDVTVYLCNTQPCNSANPGNIVETTTTDFSGYYSFVNVGAGTWYVAVDESTLPTGIIATYDLDNGTTNPDGVTAVMLSAGGSNFNADFGYRYDGNYSISGNVFYDLNQNGGDREAGEPGYEGQTVYLWQLAGSSYVLVGSTVTNANGEYSFTNLPGGTQYVVSTEATTPILNNAAHTTNPNNNTGTAYESVTILATNITNVDLGFFIPTDFDDLPESYTTKLSAGPYHIVNSDLRLGATIDLEPNGLASADADADGPSDDGVVRDSAFRWEPNATVYLNIAVSGGLGVVGGWFDWDNDGAFGPDEFVNFGELGSGMHSVPVIIPASYTTGQVLFVRFRVFDPANIPGGSLTADDFQGGATGGEVEGYTWNFSPTAVTLSNISAITVMPLFGLIFAVGLGGLATGGWLWRRHRQA